MKCSVCGKDNFEEAKYCTKCGNKFNKEFNHEYNHEYNSIQTPKCYGVFARLGFLLGIFGLIGSLVFGIGYLVSVPGIVFSAIGKKSNDFKLYFKARKGLIISIIATVLSFIMIYVYFYILRYIINLESKDYVYYIEKMSIIINGN